MSSASNYKRSRTDSGVSGDKRQRISSDDSEILELEESEALIEQVDGDDTKCRNGCIYLITNPINGKVYVGQTLDYKNRMSAHKYSSKNPKYYFSRAIHKYGWENFTKEILIDDVPNEDLDNLEINYIAFYDSFNREKGYNETKGGGGASGYKHTEEQLQAQSKRMTKNHDVGGGGSICFHSGTKKWVVVGSRSTSDRKFIGYYYRQEKACQALNLYNETGKIMPSDVAIRKSGTGSVLKKKNGRFNNGRFQARYKGKNVGTFASEEKALAALKLYIETGKIMPSDKTTRKSGTGSISKKKNGRVTAYYKGKYVGRFASEEEADQALKIHIENL